MFTFLLKQIINSCFVSINCHSVMLRPLN